MDKDPSTRAIDRFDIRQRLGAGAMGVVFEAYDRLRNRQVALKTLPNAEANALYRFKREFRTLADISHPNLVNLYELFIETDHCFFTMEVVDGPSFLSYVRPESELHDLETLAGFADHLSDPPPPKSPNAADPRDSFAEPAQTVGSDHKTLTEGLIALTEGELDTEPRSGTNRAHRDDVTIR
ncbi:MAG TPA: hypothetical protein ENJ18_11635, partial [Nannocystis exedens]|nr:hypothetical protein [Nannocystis exedens]